MHTEILSSHYFYLALFFLRDDCQSLQLATSITIIKNMPIFDPTYLSTITQVSKALGLDRAKIIFTAAAPISKSTLQYFQSLNIPLMEIYGMSETAGALTMGVPVRGGSRITSIGRIMPEAEYMIANPDEDGSGEVSDILILRFKFFHSRIFDSLLIFTLTQEFMIFSLNLPKVKFAKLCFKKKTNCFHFSYASEDV